MPDTLANPSSLSPPSITAELILDITFDIALPPASAFIPTPAIAAPSATISFSAIPTVVPVPDRRCEKFIISDSWAAILFNFVIVKAFYPLLLIVSYKFSVHFQPRGLSDTLGGIFALLTLILYALRCRVIFSITSVLAYYF